MSDPVNRPSHYNQGKFEVIEIIEDQQTNFHLGNAIKYICRAGKKNKDKTIEDLQKAIWYINRYIEIQKPDAEIRRPNDMNERRETGFFTENGLKFVSEIRRDPEAARKLDESYKKGDIVKIIADDEYYGILCKIYENCVDSTRKDLYAVVPISGETNLGQKIYAGCSLQLVSRP